MKTNMKKALAAMALMTAGITGLSENKSYTNTFDVNLTTPDWVTNFTIPQLMLNAGIGETLNSVVFELVSKLQADVNLVNLEANRSNQIGGLLRGEVSVTPPTVNGPYTNAIQIGETNHLGPLQSMNILGLMASVTSTMTMTDLSPFLGWGSTSVGMTGMMTMPFVATSLDGKQADGGSVNLIASMLNVIFNYTAVPEPGTWGAMGVVGTGALWALCRRKKS